MATVHVLHIKVGVNWAVAFPLSPELLGSSAGFTSAFRFLNTSVLFIIIAIIDTTSYSELCFFFCYSYFLYDSTNILWRKEEKRGGYRQRKGIFVRLIYQI